MLKRQTILELIRYLNSLLPKTPAKKKVITNNAAKLFGVDGESIPSSRAMHMAGISFFCGYLSYTGNPKNLTRVGVRRLKRDGFGIVTVFETTAQRSAAGRSAGEADALSALRQLKELGAPPHAPIFFAVDFDATPYQVRHYFEGVTQVLGNSGRRGAYGSYRITRWLHANGLIDYGFQTYAWSSGARDYSARLYQYSNGHRIGGVEVDLDRATATDYGQWRW